MRLGYRSVLVPVIVVAALIAYYRGWALLWFLTDDAYIAFRYVSNSQLGFGYVWNAPPFLPVEGYTSFLWVVLLDDVWSWFGIEPPGSSNWLAFIFGAGTLVLTALMALRLRLAAALEPYRVALVVIVLAGVVSNFTFLMWTSSGLETSLFNFLFLAWVAAALSLKPGSAAWIAGLCGSAGLLALTRPDGLLVAAATSALIAAVILTAGGRVWRARLLAVTPLLVPLVHVLWRRSFYGDWLPNTYYAKHLEAWPEAGIRYLLSYVMEYGLWLWAIVGVAALFTALRAAGRPAAMLRKFRSDPRRLSAAWVVGTLAAHVGYYTLRVGGDHFEYRVYSHTVPLVLLSAVWMTGRLVEGGRLPGRLALAVPAAIVMLSWPIPWTLWARAQAADTRETSFNLVVPVADAFPPGIRWYVRGFDALQRWLIEGHDIGKRYQEHRVFHLFRSARFPRQRQLGEEWYAEHRVFTSGSVGVVGWILARAHVIDTLGLNDYVVARSPLRRYASRKMAHDRQPPSDYVECFRPDVSKPQAGGRLRKRVEAELREHRAGPFRYRVRRPPLTSSDIEACEREWRAWAARSVR